MIEFRITVTGTAPLLMHNSRLADPLNPATKALKRVTGKRKKTDEDHEEIARLEFLGGLYHDTDIGPFIPGENIERCLVDAAKISRRGADLKRGMFIQSDINPLSYPGPRAVSEIWEDENFRHMASVKVTTNRTMRCRPIFRQWKTAATGLLDPAVIDLSDLEAIAVTAGQMIGLGDWRPRFGRFDAVLEKA